MPKNSENSENKQLMVILGYMLMPIVGSLYTSADMEEDLHITLQPVDEFQHMRDKFGVVFHDQSNGELTVHIS